MYIFGAGDNFFGQFAAMLRWLPVFPLVCPTAEFAPVWVDDVAEAFALVLEGDGAPGTFRAHDLCGPRTYTFRELIEFTSGAMGKRRLVIGVPNWAARPGPSFAATSQSPLYAGQLSLTSGCQHMRVQRAAVPRDRAKRTQDGDDTVAL